MDARQKLLDWDKRDRDLASLEEHLTSVLKEVADVRLLVSIAAEDRGRADTSYVRKSKRDLALAAQCSANTVVAALRRLARQQVASYEAGPSCHEVLIDWSAVWRLSPCGDGAQRLRDALEASRMGGSEAAGQTVVRGGQGSTRVLGSKSKSRATVNRVPSTVPRGLQNRLVRPWSDREGFRGEDLQWAVRSRSKHALQRLYWAAVEAGWWQDCESFRVRFLSCCWQAVESAKKSPMGLLVHMAKRNMRDRDGSDQEDRDSWITGAAEQWAVETRRLWRRRDAGLATEGEPVACAAWDADETEFEVQ